MKRSISKKLILSSCALAATAICLTSTTFAWFAKNGNAWTDEFDLNVRADEGLEISLNGTDYSQDIPGDQIKTEIAGSVEAFNNLMLIGCSPKQVENNSKMEISHTDNVVDFVYDHVDYVSDTYSHIEKAAVKNTDYISFDVYLKTVNIKEDSPRIKLTLGPETSMKANHVDEIKPHSAFDTYEWNGTSYVKTHHSTSDAITQDISNAMRLGIYNKEFSIYEVTNDKDLGSAAITGKTDSKHDPYNSMMVQYYNAYFPLYPFVDKTITGLKDADGKEMKGVYGATDGPAYNTITSYGKWETPDLTKPDDRVWKGENLGEFEKQGQEDVIKLTVYIWLEGWDADYLVGTSREGSKLKVNLEFAPEKIV